jgi:hypothetical protein
MGIARKRSGVICGDKSSHFAKKGSSFRNENSTCGTKREHLKCSAESPFGSCPG